jgi:hypothetical protein
LSSTFRLGEDNQVHDTQYQIISGKSSDEEKSRKRDEGSARRVKTARRGSSQQAESWGTRTRYQDREYYDSWHPSARGQDGGYLFGDHYP